MDDTSRDELAALRRRAYGPDADILGDPDALDLLERLERGERQARTSDADADADETEPVDSTENEPDAAPGPMPEGAPVLEPGAQVSRPRPVAARWLLAWAASVVAVAVGVGALVFALASVPPVPAAPAATGARQIATLTARVPVPEQISSWVRGADPSGFPFEGLILVPTPVGVGVFGRGSDCLLLGPLDGFQADGTVQGDVFYSCRAGGFPAAIQFAVSSSSPEPLRERFPLGTALQFVLDGDRVGVFVSGAEEDVPVSVRSAP